MKKNIIITFMCACFPGFGQMYFGYMKRGASLATAFWGAIAFASLFWGSEAVLLLLPVIWGYSFFDTFNIRALTEEQRHYFVDEFLLINNIKYTKKISSNKMNRFIGIALVALGALGIYRQIYSSLYWRLSERFPFFAEMFGKVPQIILSLLLLFLGVKIILKHNRKDENDDIIPFKGGTQDE